jgi:hypothetical protein
MSETRRPTFVSALATINSDKIKVVKGETYEVTDATPYNDGVVFGGKKSFTPDMVGTILDETGRYVRVYLSNDVFVSADAEMDMFAQMFGCA